MANASESDSTLGVAGVRMRLRESVLDGTLRQGASYSQDAVIELLGVRRTPFREALRMVQAEGLVRMLPNGRLRAPDLSMSDFGEIQVARMALDAAAVRISVPRLDPDDIARLEGLFAQMAHFIGSADFDRLEHPHRAFHLALVAPAGDVMVSMIDELIDRTRRYRWAFAPGLPAFWDDRVAEHRAILDAANAKDAEGVVSALTHHHTVVTRQMVERMHRLGGEAARRSLETETQQSLPRRRGARITTISHKGDQ